jgi:hypothetical protein
MAAIEETFRTHLAGNAAVAAIVGARIYPMVASQPAAFPYIVYQVISSPEYIVKPRVATLRLVRKRIQVDGYAKGNGAYAAIKSLEAAIKAAAYLFTSSVNDSIVETRVLDASDDSEPEEGIYRVSIDVSILFNE